MKIGAFELDEPLPELHNPHAFALLRPWVDVSSVGSLTIAMLENQFKAQPLGKLSEPGSFFDFTRYRPVIQLKGGQREVQVPNSLINYAKGPHDNDLVFLHLLEPHMLGEAYAESILKVLRKLGISRYCLLGAMYDAVPHTKPLIVTGAASGSAESALHALGVRSSDYEGPTTIAILASLEASKYDIETMTLIVHLPQYSQLDEDYAGRLRLLEVICSLYNFPIDLEQSKHEAEEQYAKLSLAAEKQPGVKEIIEWLEAYYEARIGEAEEEPPKLSPEVERFLREMDKRFGQS
jgi:predicted ATP-grasp superfamily ATP-dependent carboligase